MFPIRELFTLQMHIISRSSLRDFGILHPDAKSRLDAWFAEANKATWKTPQQILQFYKATIVNGERVVFDIGGGKYRIVARINYKSETIFIRFVGTHGDYDKIDAGTI